MFDTCFENRENRVCGWHPRMMNKKKVLFFEIEKSLFSLLNVYNDRKLHLNGALHL